MSAAPRVLVAGSVLGQPMGGVRRHNRELLPRVARLLEARGGALAILEGRTPPAFELPDSVERIASEVPAAPALLRAAHESRALASALLAAAKRGRPFDLVHTGHLPAPRALSVPFTLTLHDLRRLDPGESSLPARLAARAVIGSAVRRAARVFTVGECVRAELLERFGLEPQRVQVVPNAADHFEPLPRRPDEAARLLCLGHVEPRKNLELVLRALALDPTLPGLDIAGAAKAGERERLERLAHELDLGLRVRFLGPFADEELAGLYARAACAVFPSRIEGFGIGVLEAMRARCPLAFSRIAAHLEVAGESACSFAPDDPAGCRDAIRAACAQDEAARDALAERSGRTSWDASAEAWVRDWSALVRCR